LEPLQPIPSKVCDNSCNTLLAKSAKTMSNEFVSSFHGLVS
jgi:hypothetical protein